MCVSQGVRDDVAARSPFSILSNMTVASSPKTGSSPSQYTKTLTSTYFTKFPCGSSQRALSIFHVHIPDMSLVFEESPTLGRNAALLSFQAEPLAFPVRFTDFVGTNPSGAL